MITISGTNILDSSRHSNQSLRNCVILPGSTSVSLPGVTTLSTLSDMSWSVSWEMSSCWSSCYQTGDSQIFLMFNEAVSVVGGHTWDTKSLATTNQKYTFCTGSCTADVVESTIVLQNWYLIIARDFKHKDQKFKIKAEAKGRKNIL